MLGPGAATVEAFATARRTVSGWSPIRFGLALAREIADDDVPGMAAEMAYRFLFAIFPLLLLSAAVLGLIGATIGREDLLPGLLARLTLLLPEGLAPVVEAAALDLVSDRPGTYATIGLIATVWGASGGVGALIKGLNRAYDVAQPRATWRRQLIAIGATVALPAVGLALLVISVVGHGLTGWLGDLLGIRGLMAASLAASQAVVGAVVFFLAMLFAYRLLPARRQRLGQVVPGALVAAVGWTAITQALGSYIGNVDRYSATYGAFAAPIAFLFWLYAVGLVVLVGAEINALLSPAGRPTWADVRDPRKERR